MIENIPAEILMIKESCNLIGWNFILAYNFKFCILNWEKNSSVSLKIN